MCAVLVRVVFFFFQAEDGIRDKLVTGVQTCALPISTGAEAFSRVNSDTFEIVLLDLTLPERDGLEILAALRQRRLETRVLILTARDKIGRASCRERV